ncbi:hypothetical protein QYF36_025801 [Acer negundo]|nr:hypothetical protein QYF36_025801 [Acer negundo]
MIHISGTSDGDRLGASLNNQSFVFPTTDILEAYTMTGALVKPLLQVFEEVVCAWFLSAGFGFLEDSVAFSPNGCLQQRGFLMSGAWMCFWVSPVVFLLGACFSAPVVVLFVVHVSDSRWLLSLQAWLL